MKRKKTVQYKRYKKTFDRRFLGDCKDPTEQTSIHFLLLKYHPLILHIPELNNSLWIQPTSFSLFFSSSSLHFHLLPLHLDHFSRPKLFRPNPAIFRSTPPPALPFTLPSTKPKPQFPPSQKPLFLFGSKVALAVLPWSAISSSSVHGG